MISICISSCTWRCSSKVWRCSSKVSCNLQSFSFKLKFLVQHHDQHQSLSCAHTLCLRRYYQHSFCYTQVGSRCSDCGVHVYRLGKAHPSTRYTYDMRDAFSIHVYSLESQRTPRVLPFAFLFFYFGELHVQMCSAVLSLPALQSHDHTPWAPNPAWRNRPWAPPR